MLKSKVSTKITNTPSSPRVCKQRKHNVQCLSASPRVVLCHRGHKHPSKSNRPKKGAEYFALTTIAPCRRRERRRGECRHGFNWLRSGMIQPQRSCQGIEPWLWRQWCTIAPLSRYIVIKQSLIVMYDWGASYRVKIGKITEVEEVRVYMLIL